MLNNISHREMQNKTTKRYHFISTRMAKDITVSVGRVWRNGNPKSAAKNVKW